MDSIRSYLGQGNEDKATFMKPGMGNGQIGILHDQVVIEEDIQIHGTGTLGNRPFPVEHIRLDPLQFSEEVVRCEAGFKAKNGVQKAVLVDRAHRFRIIEAGEGGDAGTGNLSDFGDGPEKVQFTVT
jgi:hypothetical protein